MALQLVITPQVYLLVTLLIENAIKLALDTVSKMTPEEIEAGIVVEEAKKRTLMTEIASH